MQAYVCMCLAKVNGEAAKEGTSNAETSNAETAVPDVAKGADMAHAHHEIEVDGAGASAGDAWEGVLRS